MAGGSHVQVCGTLHVRIEAHDVSHHLPAGQARVLLTYLVLTRLRTTDRSALPSILWNADPPPSAERVVAALLSRLRSVLGPSVLPPRGEPHLRLPEPAKVDIEGARQAAHSADAAVAAGDWPAAWASARIALYTAQRDLLPGVDLDWVAAERDALRDIRWRAWEAVGEAGLGLGGSEVVSSRRAARELMREEPLRESGYRLAMRAALAQGNTAEALSIYDRLRTRLADELGVDPGPESRALFKQILSDCTVRA